MHVNLYAFVSPWFQVYLAFARFCGPSCVGPRGQAEVLSQQGFVLKAPGSVYLWLLCVCGGGRGLCHKTTSVSVSPRVFSQVPSICPCVHVCVCESLCGPMCVQGCALCVYVLMSILSVRVVARAHV